MDVAISVGDKAARRYGCEPLSNSRKRRLRQNAESLYLDIWTIAWTQFPTIHYTCDPIPESICSTLDTVPLKTQIRKRIKRTQARIRTALGDCARTRSRGLNTTNRAKKFRRQIIREMNNVPDEALVCIDTSSEAS